MTEFAIAPPIEPMLAKLAEELPAGDGFLYEPKWDGFRAIVFRGATTSSSRAATCGRSIATFPSCTPSSASGLPAGCVLDGEIVIATAHGLDFDALQLRLHPAASRVAKLAEATPGGFRRLRPAGGRRPRSPRRAPQSERRSALEALLGEQRAADPPDADDARSRARGRVARALRRRRPRRRHRQAGDGRLRAGQARDDQDQARAHRRLRRRRLPLAQERRGDRRLAAARALRRDRARSTTWA